MTDYTTELAMSTHICGECGIVWAMTKEFEEARMDDHKTFYCPNGHGRYYSQESDKEKLKRKLKLSENCCISAKIEADYFERSSRAYKGHFNRVKRNLEINEKK